ncbi:MAG TPA: peptidylprolyl isomerase [Marinilabiliaceae bacterium]|nr:peptidylprolyl isomerase [Marinilabiliaceae bacterium]
MKLNFFLLTAFLLFQMCGLAQEKPTMVLVETDFGNMKIELYDDTPLHRDNFIKLVKDGFYNGTLFHRVINGFMIQGGDPQSVTAAPNQRLGAGGPGYLVDAEIVYPKHFHKKGALAAARQGDQGNPERKSSGSQFYLVHGEIIKEADLHQMEKMKTQQMEQTIFTKYVMPFRNELVEMQKEGNEAGLKELLDKLRADAESEISALKPFKFTPEQIKAYSTLGGAPQLDGDYTVFGEVVEGLEVIDKIAALETDPSDRPITDVAVKLSIIGSKK